MSRLIDAERFDVVTDTIPKGMDMESYVAGQQSILNMIYDAPVVEETIRCEDCKHKVGEHDGYICCDKNTWHEPDWFCADGERKEE